MKARKPAVPPPWVQLAMVALDLKRTDPEAFRLFAETLEVKTK